MTQWVRLWEDMPTDPKWRIIAKRSGRPACEVIALFTVMMTNAGGADTRGSLASWDDEAAAMVLDMEEHHVAAIREAMQGRVLDGDRLLGWDTWMRGRPCAGDWAVIRDRVFRRDDFTCQYCGTRGGKLECDHVVPVSKGGHSGDDNLKTSCFACNRAKGDKTIVEWLQ